MNRTEPARSREVKGCVDSRVNTRPQFGARRAFDRRADPADLNVTRKCGEPGSRCHPEIEVFPDADISADSDIASEVILRDLNLHPGQKSHADTSHPTLGGC